MSDDETIRVYDHHVEDYVGCTRRQEPDPTLLAFIDRIPAGGHVLDLGCGPGNSSVVMRDRGLRVDPVDASAAMVRWANETHQIGARQLTFDNLVATDHYHGVWANFSLLHAEKADFPRHLAALHRSLVPGGVFHIGMKLGEGSRRDSLGRFYAYYCEADLTDHLAEAGFTIVGSKTGEDSGLSGEIAPWITLTAKAQNSGNS